MKLIPNDDCEIGKYYVIYDKIGNMHTVSLNKWDSLFTKTIYTKTIIARTEKLERLTYELDEDEIFYFVSLKEFAENI